MQLLRLTCCHYQGAMIAITAALTSIGFGSAHGQEPKRLTVLPSTAEELQFLENDHLKIGVKPASGGAIAWVSLAKSDQNLVDHYDRGRLIQQSYYGKRDGSLWNEQPWHWNPVQGGGWRGEPAKILESRMSDGSLFVRSQPKHWATGEDLPETKMEQTLTLRGPVLHVHYRFLYEGKETHPARHQEIPAIFLTHQYDRLVLYSGDKPWTEDGLSRSIPGWPNESRKITEHWAAYVDENDFGLGAYVPVADELTCYRFGDGKPANAACSYFAPLKTFSIHPGLVWEYDLYLTVGKVREIRQRFAILSKS